MLSVSIHKSQKPTLLFVFSSSKIVSCETINEYYLISLLFVKCDLLLNDLNVSVRYIGTFSRNKTFNKQVVCI